MRGLTMLALLAGCPQESKYDGETDPTVTDDTGDTDTTPSTCTVAVIGTTPEDGATDVYYRETIELSFDGDASSALVEVRDASGAVVADSPTWSDGNVQAFLDVVLEPSTTYTLHVELCEVTTETSFTTSALGAALSLTSEDLVGRTYVFRLSDTTITEPGFLDALAGSFLTVPLLFGITAADSSTIDMLGALGYHEDDGSYTQLVSQATWDFPAGDFNASPYFTASATEIVITYDSVPIPISDFTLAGTFSADGTYIQEGLGTGLGDTRNLGTLLNQEGNLSAVCDIAESAGVTCEACPDGEPYCLYIVAEEITATWEEGLTLVEVAE